MASGGRKAATTRAERARRDCDAGFASATSLPITIPIDDENSAPVGERAQLSGCISSERSVDAAPAGEVDGGAQLGERHRTRDDPIRMLYTEGSPTIAVTAVRQADSSAVQDSSGAAAAAEPFWPSEAELFQLLLPMLTGGNGSPATPAVHFQPAEATYELLVRVKSAVATLKKQHGDEMHMVPGTSGRIDQQEARGYALGAVLGRGLLSREEAKVAGLDARNKLTALERRLAVAKETARRAAGVARKAGGGAVETQAAAARTEREAIERERIELDLPLPLPPPMPPSAAGRKRAEPPPPDPMQQRFEAWCRRHDPGGVANPVAYYEHQRKYARLSRAMTARRWKPRSWAARRDKAQTLALQQRSNQLCECDDDVPSILCRAHACYAFEIGTCDGLPPERVAPNPSSRISCSCMRHAWGGDPEQRWPAHKPQLMIDATEDYDFLTEETKRFLYFAWLDPMPGGQYGPGFDPEAAARKLTTMDVHPGASERYGFSYENYPSFGKV